VFHRLTSRLSSCAPTVQNRHMIAFRLHRAGALPPALLALGALLGAAPSGAGAQLAHYWGDHFGNESVLLNGAVIGSVTDAGAVFYNPARLLHQTSPSLVASAKLYEWTSIRIKDGLGVGRDLKDSRFGGAPGFLVGTFTLPFLEGHQFAYGVMTRHRFSANTALRDEAGGDVIPSLPGEESFVGINDLQTNFKDDWMGLSWAYPLGDDLSVGATLFYFERSSSRLARFDLKAINETLQAQTLEVERSYGVRDKGLVAKLGLAWRRGDWSLGVSSTLPYWALTSKGTIRYENFGVGLHDSTGAPIDNVLESSIQGGRPAEWKTPWSFGGGVGWTAGEWQLHVAAEYFTAVPRHVLTEADTTELGQSTGAPIEYTVFEERKGVLNGGVGVTWSPSGDLSVFGSVVTNNSSAPDSAVGFTELQPEVSHTSQTMDFLLYGGGVSFHTRWADFTIGATRQASRERQPREFEFPDETPSPDDGLTTFEFDQWRFLIGFSVPFIEERLPVPGGG
jgi:hypothetical protein